MADPWNDDIVQFAASFMSLSVTPTSDQPKIRVRRGVGDLMHTLGYYFEQNNTKLAGVSLRDRLRMASNAMNYVADNLET